MAAIAQVERLTIGIPDELLLGEGEDFHLRTTLAGAVVTGVNEAVSGMSEVLNGSFFITLGISSSKIASINDIMPVKKAIPVSRNLP
mgnify:CR=1 FL=1